MHFLLFEDKSKLMYWNRKLKRVKDVFKPNFCSKSMVRKLGTM